MSRMTWWRGLGARLGYLPGDIFFNCCTDQKEPVDIAAVDILPSGYEDGRDSDAWSVYGAARSVDCWREWSLITDCPTRRDAEIVSGVLARRWGLVAVNNGGAYESDYQN